MNERVKILKKSLGLTLENLVVNLGLVRLLLIKPKTVPSELYQRTEQ
ncbi:MAG: hypothetical protein K2J90_07340 [Lachnospiraceae bacterium]|nr:hypothetical protein [Lachnospiraceae bacterium]